MANGVVEKRSNSLGDPSVKEQRIRREGKLVTIRKVHLASPTFGEDTL